MPTRGEAPSLLATELTSLKRWLRWKASMNFSLCRSARLKCTSLPRTMAHEPRENRTRTPRTSFAIGPAWKKKRKIPGPCWAPNCMNVKAVVNMRALLSPFSAMCRRANVPWPPTPAKAVPGNYFMPDDLPPRWRRYSAPGATSGDSTLTPFQILAVYGTRPEAIKMAPVISALRRRPDRFAVTVVTTGQHRELLEPVQDLFG